MIHRPRVKSICSNFLSEDDMKIELKTDMTTKEYSVEKRIETTDARHDGDTLVAKYTEDITVSIDNTQPTGIIAKVERSNVKKDWKVICTPKVRQKTLGVYLCQKREKDKSTERKSCRNTCEI